MEIRVLGPLEVLRDGRRVVVGGRRQRSVLAGLVASAGDVVSTDRLIDTVWGDDAPPSARRSLQTYVSRLRGILGNGSIARVADGYRLDAPDGTVDAVTFERRVEEAGRHRDQDPATAWALYEEALTLWRGQPLADVDLGPSTGPYVAHLEETRLRCLEERAAVGLALGRHHELVSELRALVREHPLREGLRAHLMLALYRSGRQSEALEAAADLRRTLSEELGLDPSPAIQDLEARILRHDPELHTPDDAPATGSDDAPPLTDDPSDVADDLRGDAASPTRNPYKGLRAFSESDAEDFFGREEVVDRVVSRILDGTRLLTVVGPSGCGKSSLVLAGVVPELRERATRPPLVARMTPGTHPFAQLAAALRRAAGRLPVEPRADDELSLLRAVLAIVPDEHTDVLLVIDQSEELLTGAVDDATVLGFVANLREALEDPHGQLNVVLTLRADFLDRALMLPAMSEHVTDGLVSLPPMTAADLRAAIVGPAARADLRVEPELVDELVGAVLDKPGSLPLLQFVLTELAERTWSRRLELEALRRSGGFDGALARRAEVAYGSLAPDGQEAARHLMLQLVSIDARGEATRRTVPLDELDGSGIDRGVLDGVLEAFVAERLLTVSGEDRGGGTVEVAHEAVLDAWPRCARWIEDARDHLRALSRLEHAAEEWDTNDRSDDYLLTGARLATHETDRHVAGARSASPLAAAYLAASREREDARIAAEAARAERERDLEHRAAQRMRVAVAILALLVVLSSGLWLEARRQRETAYAANQERLVRQLSNVATAQAASDPELGLLLALHAVKAASISNIDVPVETQEALHAGLQAMRIPYPTTADKVTRLQSVRETRSAYALPLYELVGLASTQIRRELTTEECQQFLEVEEEACPDLELVDIPDAEPLLTGGPELLRGTRLLVSGTWTLDQAVAFRRELAAFTAQTGIVVEYTEDSTLEGRVESGSFDGDVAVVPQPGLATGVARRGQLQELSRYLDEAEFLADYGPYLTDLVSLGTGTSAADEGVYGVPIDAGAKSLIWYSPRNFANAGYEVPDTWDELLELSELIVEDGRTPWCQGLDFGPARGWPATDLVEDLLLQRQGTAVYDGWVAGDIPFRDPRVRDAFQRAGDIYFGEGWQLGGTGGVLHRPPHEGLNLLGGAQPDCWLLHAQQGMAFGRSVDESQAFFPTPPMQHGTGPRMLGGASFAIVYTDRPEVRRLVEHLASPEFGRYLVKDDDGGGNAFLMANRRFGAANYPERWRQELAADLMAALDDDRFRFDGSDLMPPEVGTYTIWQAMVDWVVGGPGELDDVLARLDKAMEGAREDEEDASQDEGG